jgi:hypothetical protein
MSSDSLKGTVKDWKRNHRVTFSTGGPWRKPDEHRAWSSSGMTDRHKGDNKKNHDKVEQLQGGRAPPSRRHWAVPAGTHGSDGGAVNTPRWSVQNPVGSTVKTPPRKKRAKAISSR